MILNCVCVIIYIFFKTLQLYATSETVLEIINFGFKVPTEHSTVVFTFFRKEMNHEMNKEYLISSIQTITLFFFFSFLKMLCLFNEMQHLYNVKKMFVFL